MNINLFSLNSCSQLLHTVLLQVCHHTLGMSYPCYRIFTYILNQCTHTIPVVLCLNTIHVIYIKYPAVDSCWLHPHLESPAMSDLPRRRWWP